MEPKQVKQRRAKSELPPESAEATEFEVVQEDEILEREGEADEMSVVDDDPIVEAVDGEVMGLPVLAEIPETPLEMGKKVDRMLSEAITKAQKELPQSGLVVRVGDELREPTHEELVEIGRQMVNRMFGLPGVQEAVNEILKEKPPAPKLTTPHCRTCRYFSPNDSRGALWATGGLCLALQHVQPPVEPEYWCNKFIFNEGLRDAEPK